MTKFLDRFDFGWFVICFGMAMGAGVVLTPIKIGVVGFYVFIFATIIAYPSIYLFQKLYINTLYASKEPKSYGEVISELLGKKWAVILGAIYFFMMFIYTVMYSVIVAKAIASYLHMFGIIDNKAIDRNIFFSFILMAVLVFVGIKSQKILVRVSTILMFALIATIALSSFALIPYWSMDNLQTIRPPVEFVAESIVMLPFMLTSIIFIHALSPMSVGYRQEYDGKETADFMRKKTQKVMKFTFFILVLLIGFYSFSFSLVIPHDGAIEAEKTSASAFTLLKQIDKTNIVLNFCGIVIVLFGVLASFFSVLLGMAESLTGVCKASLKALKMGERCNGSCIKTLVIVVIFLISWLSVVFDVPAMKLVPFTGPVFAVLGCFIPVYLVYKVPELRQYKTKSAYFILFVGAVLFASPIITPFVIQYA